LGRFEISTGFAKDAHHPYRMYTTLSETNGYGLVTNPIIYKDMSPRSEPFQYNRFPLTTCWALSGNRLGGLAQPPNCWLPWRNLGECADKV
jgi:hypothetical protein